MRKAFLVIFSLVCTSLMAQVPQDRGECAGIFRPYDFDGAPEPTKAPKGFKPFYISTYARHGCRNYSNNETFGKIYSFLEDQNNSDNLTESGKAFFEHYAAIYPDVNNCGSDLTAKGESEHRMHADRMYRQYREVFRHRHGVYARSSQRQRTVMSMVSFCNEIARLDRKVDIHISCSGKDHSILLGNSMGNPRCKPQDLDAALEHGPWRSQYDLFCKNKLHPYRFFASFLKRPGVVKYAFDDLYKAEKDFYYIICTSMCHDSAHYLSPFVSLEELQANWECENLRMYNMFGCCPWYNGRNNAIIEILLEDFIAQADKDIPDENVAARVRYGHDYSISAMMIMLQQPGWCKTESNPEKVKDVFQVQRITMASTFQWVFYRNGKGEILVKAMLNEHDLRFPIADYLGRTNAESSPFYRWEDFRAYCNERIARAIDILENNNE